MSDIFKNKVRNAIAIGAYGYPSYDSMSNKFKEYCDENVEKVFKKEKMMVFVLDEYEQLEKIPTRYIEDDLLHYTFNRKQMTTDKYSLSFCMLCNLHAYRYSLSIPHAQDSDIILNIGAHPGIFIVRNYDYEKLKHAYSVVSSYKMKLKQLKNNYKNSIEFLKETDMFDLKEIIEKEK